MKKNIALLGSTGSIGTQALEVISRFPDRFKVEVLTANNNTDLLIQQAIRYKPRAVVIANSIKFREVAEALEKYPVRVFSGNDALNDVVTMDSIDMVLTAMVGYSGLIPTYNALQAGKDIALANKETLVVAGSLITKLACQKNARIIPVDSEHSAIFQCLAGEQVNQVEKIILTCSGGPFRGKTTEELRHVAPAAALAHPNWDMGAKITIDSASLINKGFEMIEAHWLFGLPPEKIEVIVHPQSIIHSIVQFTDGSMKAQMGLPDMRIPIQYALTCPERLANDFPRFSFSGFPGLTFENPDTSVFRNLSLSYEALRIGGNMPCALNAANEIVVEEFLKQRIGFLDMAEIIERTLERVYLNENPGLDDFIHTNQVTREIVKLLIDKHEY
jgi:1-deoxy-D-xylulose-5-phosphate reductoisomerase